MGCLLSLLRGVAFGVLRLFLWVILAGAVVVGGAVCIRMA